MGSIMTAFQLTATEELRQKHDITIYQMGWRLGGKLASGANTRKNYRNEEHGLHVWFGFYDNAFSELRKCYAELLQLQPRFLYSDVMEAFQPNDFTPIGRRTYDPEGYDFWPFTWPIREKDSAPGENCKEYDSTLAMVAGCVEFVWGLAKECFAKELGELVTGDALDEHLKAYEMHQASAGEAVVPRDPDAHPVEHGFRAAISWLKSGAERIEHFAEHEAEQLSGLVHGIASELLKLPLEKPDDHPALSILVLGSSIVKGILNPKYDLLRDLNLNKIDDWDLREWLLEIGANEGVVNGSSFVRALYDIPFAYENGDMNKPNFAAGASLRWALRTFMTYRKHALYVPQAGFGEAVIAPYYEVLKARGVKFKFFHKLSHVELTQNRNQIAALHFDVQAETKDGSPYDPVWFEDQLYRWPVEPRWEQIKDAEKLQAQGARFESHWNPCPPVGQLTLRQGQDFDLVVLGIAGTAMKKRNDVDQLFCQELIDASPEFAAWTGNLGTVCTSGVQFWFTKPVTDLGWPRPPATVGGPEPTDVWADMSPVLDTEHWSGVPGKPESLHYLCGPLPTELFNEPASATTVPDQAHQLCHDVTRTWLEDNGRFDWPGATGANGEFDWNVMYDAQNGTGTDRLDAQFLRANIDPTECCGNSFAGTTRYRPYASDRLFANLCIVGADTETGINVTCVEGATISAMRASRSICGAPHHICNENFMSGPFPAQADTQEKTPDT